MGFIGHERGMRNSKTMIHRIECFDKLRITAVARYCEYTLETTDLEFDTSYTRFAGGEAVGIAWTATIRV